MSCNKVSYKKIASALDIEFVDILPNESIFWSEGYVPYGGGSAGIKNGHYGCKHTDEAKEKIRQKALGRIPYNKGIPNPDQRNRMILSNPMKRSDVVKKVSLKLRGRVAHNKGRKATIEEIERNRQAQLSLPQLACPHCSKLIRNPGNMKQHTFEQSIKRVNE